MKAYKVEILVIDFDNLGQTQIENQIECVSYPNDCISPVIYGIKEADIGEWSDDHPLNSCKKKYDYYNEIFK